VALGADVRVADPHVVEAHAPRGITRVALDAGEVQAADAVVLLTDHDAFDARLLRDAGAPVLDTRHVLPPGAGVSSL